MPNWTSNLLRVSGPRLYRSIFADSMYRAGHERGLDGVPFTYAEVLPMPEILRGTRSPLPRTEEQLRADAAAYGWSKETLEHHLFADSRNSRGKAFYTLVCYVRE